MHRKTIIIRDASTSSVKKTILDHVNICCPAYTLFKTYGEIVSIHPKRMVWVYTDPKTNSNVVLHPNDDIEQICIGVLNDPPDLDFTMITVRPIGRALTRAQVEGRAPVPPVTNILSFTNGDTEEERNQKILLDRLVQKSVIRSYDSIFRKENWWLDDFYMSIRSSDIKSGPTFLLVLIQLSEMYTQGHYRFSAYDGMDWFKDIQFCLLSLGHPEHDDTSNVDYFAVHRETWMARDGVQFWLIYL